MSFNLRCYMSSACIYFPIYGSDIISVVCYAFSVSAGRGDSCSTPFQPSAHCTSSDPAISQTASKSRMIGTSDKFKVIYVSHIWLIYPHTPVNKQSEQSRQNAKYTRLKDTLVFIHIRTKIQKHVI